MDQSTSRTIKGYQLLDLIGEGAYGAVYRARQEAVDREVAVKIILPEYANRPEFIRRFETEAQLVAQLEHIHIVPLYDYWRDPDGAFLVMRLMKGGSLQEIIDKGALPTTQAAHLLDQIGSALSAAHRRGVIHRDLKPANILLDEDGNAYLSDFGIAKALGETADLTATGAILGTPAFIAPEQVQSMPVSPQTDIYALGVLLFTMLTGEHPFPDSSPGDFLIKHVTSPLPSITTSQLELPPALDQVIQKATAKEPSQRYPDIHSFLSDFHQVLGPELAPPPTRPLTDQILEVSNPYKGLRPFLEADAEDFFGRQELTGQLLTRLGEGSEYSRFLAVVGPSGSGKSSLVKAGLLPTLRQGSLPGSKDWFIVSMTPGSRPLDELEVSLLRVAAEKPPDLMTQLQRDGFGLLRAAQLILPDEGDQLLLVVDQFEELFTLTKDPAQARHFMDLIFQSVTDPHSPVRVVITLRADFYDRPLMEPDFSALVQKRTEVVVPLTPIELERAICGPAERVGVSLEPGLETEIITDLADQPGSLPLLQYALTELFERRQGRLLTREAYQSIGGVLGALGRRAEEVYQGLEVPEQALSRQVFLRLVSLGEGVEDTRRRVLRSELTAIDIPNTGPDPGELTIAVDRVLESYGKARLLSFDHDPQTRAPTVEVAHEALLREWERLRDWLDESRGDIRMQRILDASALDWLDSGRDPSFLLRGSRLAQFEGWAEETSLALTRDEKQFLQTSLEDEAKRKAKQAALERRSRNFLRALVAVFAVAAIVAVGLTIFAFNQQGIAQENEATALAEADARATQQAIAESEADKRATQQAIAENETIARGEAEQVALDERNEARRQAGIGLAGMALNELNGDKPERAVPLALEAIENYPYTWQARRALGMAVLNHRLDLRLQHEGSINYSDLSNDGKRLLASSADGTVRIWDIEQGEELLVLKELTEPLAIWFPDESRMLIFGGDDEEGWWFQVRDSFTGELLHLEELEAEWVWYTDFQTPFSPNGERFATGQMDGSVRIWETSSVKELLRLSTEEQEPGATWSPAGDIILISNIYINELVARDATSGEIKYNLDLSDYALPVFGDWSPSGDRFSIREFDRMRIFDTASGSLLQEFNVPGVRISLVRFSHDGTQIITSGREDGTARLWDSQTGELQGAIGGLVQAQGIAWSPSDDLVAISGGGGIHIWDPVLNAEKDLIPIVGADIFQAEWTPDGKQIIVPSFISSEIRIFNLSQALYTSPGLSDFTGFAAWSPDNQNFGASLPDASVQIWDSDSWEDVYEINAGDHVIGGSWSPSGHRIMTWSLDGPLRVWDATNGQLVVESPQSEEVLFYAEWSPDGSQIVGTTWEEGNVEIYDAVTLEKLSSYSVEKGPFVQARWSPDGKRIATTGYRGEAAIRDASTGEVLLQFFPDNYSEQTMGIAWTSDGKHVIISGPGIGYLFDASTGEELMQYIGYNDISSIIILSPDDHFVYFMVSDGTARVFEVESGVELLVYEVGGWVNGSLSPDGTRLLLTSTLGEIGIYPTWRTLEELTTYAKVCCVKYELTPEEREQFGLQPK